MQVKLEPTAGMYLELIGPPGSNVPNLEAAEFPVISCMFFDVSMRLFKGTFSNDEMLEFNAEGSLISERPDATKRDRRYYVRLTFGSAVITFDCADMYQTISAASEVSG